MLLRDVHYVCGYGSEPCRMAWVHGSGIDSANMHVYLDPLWDIDWSKDDPQLILSLEGVVYDPKGAMKTFHLEDECPFRHKVV